MFTSVSKTGTCSFKNQDEICGRQSSKSFHCALHTAEYKIFIKTEKYKYMKLIAKIKKLNSRINNIKRYEKYYDCKNNKLYKLACRLTLLLATQV